MQAYLFVHFREKTTPDGEQVHFAISRDGFHWEEVNGGRPVLWAYYGDKGARDFTIVRCRFNNKFYIFGTDLSLSYGMRNQYKSSWEMISKHGSKCFSVWESDNLVDWTEQKLIKIGTDDFGCMWAPDIIYDKDNHDYVIHWSSSHKSDNYSRKRIYFSRTRDFEHFSEPGLLYQKEDSGVIDSAIYEEDGMYYMFVKSKKNPASVILLKSGDILGPYTEVKEFYENIKDLDGRFYEAPTAVRLENGKWCLFLDYFGVPGAGQGYVPFIGNSLKEGRFVRSDKDFYFPYRFKHGTILAITPDEYERIKNHD